jgi:hypothetical protein
MEIPVTEVKIATGNQILLFFDEDGKLWPQMLFL